MEVTFSKVWGSAMAVLDASRRVRWSDLMLMLGVAGLILGLASLTGEVTGTLRPAVEIDLSPWALPKYTFYSLMRGLVAYTFSLLFTLVYGYWAAKDPLAERVLVPLLDILQSIPVLGFMPGLVLALVALFPHSNLGLELSAVLMIFTGQAWNMTFSFYHSLRSLPPDLADAALVYRFDWWRRFRVVELPFATMGLVWNSMMSMAGGWFFLMINESFVLGDKDFRLPGIGSYMSVAVAHGDYVAMAWAIFAMVAMIVVLDQLVWRPIVVWAQKFRLEEGGEQETMTSWFGDWLRQSHLAELLAWLWRRLRPAPRPVAPAKAPGEAQGSGRTARLVSLILFLALLAGLLAGGAKLLVLLSRVTLGEWLHILSAAWLTLARVLTAVALGTLWALPAGLAIGLSPRLSRLLQPVVQVAAAFPAPMIFPLVIAILYWLGVPLGLGSILLMLLGTQWYILFNVIAGTMAIPADLKESTRLYRIAGWQRFRILYLPAVFPHLVTGWATAAGGAWNASIVCEYVTRHGQTSHTFGLGAMVSEAAFAADFPVLAGSVVTMALMVVIFNRQVWRRCYRLAEERYGLNA